MAPPGSLSWLCLHGVPGSGSLPARALPAHPHTPWSGEGSDQILEDGADSEGCKGVDSGPLSAVGISPSFLGVTHIYLIFFSSHSTARTYSTYHPPAACANAYACAYECTYIASRGLAPVLIPPSLEYITYITAGCLGTSYLGVVAFSGLWRAHSGCLPPGGTSLPPVHCGQCFRLARLIYNHCTDPPPPSKRFPSEFCRTPKKTVSISKAPTPRLLQQPKTRQRTTTTTKDNTQATHWLNTRKRLEGSTGKRQLTKAKKIRFIERAKKSSRLD